MPPGSPRFRLDEGLGRLPDASRPVGIGAVVIADRIGHPELGASGGPELGPVAAPVRGAERPRDCDDSEPSHDHSAHGVIIGKRPMLLEASRPWTGSERFPQPAGDECEV